MNIFDFPNKLPTKEAWGLGGNVTLLGVAVVFLALVCLILLTFVYPKFFGWLLPRTDVIKAGMADKKAARKMARAQAKAARKATIIAVEHTEQEKTSADIKTPADDSALIAVITAAVAASLGASSNGIRIKSLRRSGVNTPAWGQEGRYEQFRY